MKSQAEPRTLEVEGNNGGSYVRITEVREGIVRLRVGEGIVHLRVGETCVVAVDQEISVAALAAVLTWARDRGFQATLDEYAAHGGGSPYLRVDVDPAVAARAPRDGACRHGWSLRSHDVCPRCAAESVGEG